MTSLILALMLGVAPADAAGVRVIFRVNTPPKHHVCTHPGVYEHRHHNRSPSHKIGGTWVWVPKHRVKHARHYHRVPGHWEFREIKRR